MINLVSIEEQLEPILKQIVDSPQGQAEIAIVKAEIINVIQGQIKAGLLTRIIKKIKEMFNMDNTNTTNTGTVDGTMTLGAATTAPAWTDTRTQAELNILSAGIQAMAAHQSWPTVRDALIPNLVSLLVNYGANLAISKLSKK